MVAIFTGETTASDLCAFSWSKSPWLAAVNAMTQRTRQQLMSVMSSDVTQHQGVCVPVMK